MKLDWWNCFNDWTYSTVCKSNSGPFPLHLGPIPHYEYCIGTYSTVSIFHLGPIPQSQNSFWDLFHTFIFFSNTMGRIGPNWEWKKSQSFWDHFHPPIGTYSTLKLCGTNSTLNKKWDLFHRFNWDLVHLQLWDLFHWKNWDLFHFTNCFWVKNWFQNPNFFATIPWTWPCILHVTGVPDAVMCIVCWDRGAGRYCVNHVWF